MPHSPANAQPARALPWRAGQIAVLVVLLLAPVLVASAQGPATLVKDIDARAEASAFSSPDQFVVIGDTTYFMAEDGSNGRELWRSDGTEAGTELVKDIRPGNGGLSNPPVSVPALLLGVNGTLYFSYEGQFWKSDGTAPGTVLVKNFNVPSEPATITTLAGVGARVFFVTSSGIDQRLWQSDGTPSGTLPVKSLTPMSTSTQLVDFNGTLFFTDANQLWKSDGTPAGTLMVADVAAYGLHTALGSLFFSTGSAGDTSGATWWKSDGTGAGTIPIAPVLPSTIVEIDGRLFFENSQALWTSDGTAAGTVKVSNTPFQPYGLTNLAGRLLFVSGAGLWTSDGTAAGTIQIKDLRPEWDGLSFLHFAAVGDRLFFVSDDRIGNDWGTSLWVSDGTATGTTILRTTSDYAPRGLTDANGTLLFAAEFDDTGLELWRSDGTVAGTTRVKNIHTRLLSSYPRFMTEVDGTLFFTADGSAGRELWKTDGSGAGTVLVKDIYPGEPGSDPRQLTKVGGTLFFVAREPGGGAELWKSDGTSAGTVRVRDIMPGPDGSAPFWLTNLGGILFFVAFDPTHGRELWRSDGTVAGTQLVADINPGLAGADPGWPVVFDGGLYFGAHDGARGYELWRSDGTAAGTALVADVLPGAASAEVGCLSAVDGVLFFCARDTGADQRVWKSDGTGAGTVLVADIGPSVSGPQLDAFTSVRGSLVFSARHNDGTVSQWRSDGTAAGTTMIGARTSWNYTNLPGGLYFSAGDSASGYQLWRSDGTAAGTIQIATLAPVPSSPPPDSFIEMPDGGILFTAAGAMSGIELWRSDGTAAGTVQVQDISPGAGSSSPFALTVFGGRVVMSANDGTHGQELWSAPLADVALSALVPLSASLTTGANQPVSGTLRAQGASTAPATFQLVTQGRKGMAVLTDPATGTFTYTPNPHASGPDSFSFKVAYDGRETGLATVSVSIVTAPPVAADLAVRAASDHTLSGSLPAFDPDGQPLHYRLVTYGSKGRATITNPATGAFTYTPEPGATGTDQFTYQASDGVATSAIGTVRVTIGGQGFDTFLPVVAREVAGPGRAGLPRSSP